MGLLHHRALHDALQLNSSIDKAAEFFSESLSPFEMLLRGYRESNANLIVTNQALQEAKLQTEAANRELEAFAYSVAHDLRSPLRSIDAFSGALLEDCGDKLDDMGRQNLRNLRGSVQRMAQLIEDLLLLSRITRSEFLPHQAVDLTALAHRVIRPLQRSQPNRSVEFVIAEGLVVQGDSRLLQIALENLLGNAWKFTGKRADARIELGCSESGGRRSFFVRDNGAGFDMAYAAKLFGVFQRLHSVSEFEGTGIGLATVQRVVHRHGGRIWAEAELDHGATFFFSLDGATDVYVERNGEAGMKA
jgi:light-regulated signal transduction histidine kinase (bacteriophytochrome)